MPDHDQGRIDGMEPEHVPGNKKLNTILIIGAFIAILAAIAFLT